MNAMQERFRDLKPREKVVLAAGTAAAAIIILWGLLWRLPGGAAELRDAVAEKTHMLADLRRAQAIQTAPQVAGQPSESGQSLVTLIDRTAQSLGLAETFTRTAPDTTSGADAIRVSFQNAAFDDLVEWLVMLERSYGVSVDSFSVNGTRDEGLVSGQVFLRRS
jgi:type II secretory pathway component PulM